MGNSYLDKQLTLNNAFEKFSDFSQENILFLVIAIGIILLILLGVVFFSIKIVSSLKNAHSTPKQPKKVQPKKVTESKPAPLETSEPAAPETSVEKKPEQRKLGFLSFGKSKEEKLKEVEELQRLSDTTDAVLDINGPKVPVQKKQTKQTRAKKPSARKVKKKAAKLKVPTTVQKTIPYEAVYERDGIIETRPGIFTKSYLLHDVNYQIAKQSEQDEMFLKYGEFLNSFDPSIRFQITVNQRNIDMERFEDEVLLKMREDGLDHLREERNKILKDKMLEGRNNMVKEKYLTVSIKSNDFESARGVFARLDTELAAHIKKIGNAIVEPLSTVQRLEILHDIYNIGAEGCFGNNMVPDENGNPVFAEDKFRFDIMHQQGLTTKDMIGPHSFNFKSDYGQTGDTYFRALFIRKIPTFVKDNVLVELTKTECNMLTSLLFEPIDGETAVKMARNQIVNVNANLVEKQKQASKGGYSTELVSPELRDAADEASNLLHDLTSKNQKLFYMTMVIVHFADDLETLNAHTKAIQTIGRTLLLDVSKLSWQQENGLNSALPLCYNQLQIKRTLTTESAAIFMPFDTQELKDPNGQYYGVNAVSHNLILMDRRQKKNGNGWILGTPGGGKSMMAKDEMLGVLLHSDDDVIVIDPEGEYGPMAELLGGEVIRIAAGGDSHVNPFDIDMTADSKDDPITIKSDFIVSLCETVLGERYGLTPTQRSIIDRCVHNVYRPYLESYKDGKYDENLLPTMKEFWNELRAQRGYDASALAEGLELYVTGSLDVFAHRTNVEYTKRFVVYDIKDIGNTMKSMGLLVILDAIWQRMVAGRKNKKYTWLFIDEIYLLFKLDSSAEVLRNFYKRARKYYGIPTGITQNVEDILNNDTARTMISNSESIILLNQAPLDRARLADLLNISETQLSHITNAGTGEGLIYDGKVIVPFINKVPRDTAAYQAMTTKPADLVEREKLQEAEAETDRPDAC